MRAYDDCGRMTKEAEYIWHEVYRSTSQMLDTLVARGFNVIEASQLIQDSLGDALLHKKIKLQDETYKRRKAEYEANCVQVQLNGCENFATTPAKIEAIKLLRRVSEASDGYSMGLKQAKDHVEALLIGEKSIVFLDQRKIEENLDSFNLYFKWEYVQETVTSIA